MTRIDHSATDIVLRALLCAMFFVFAMTTDAVGSIIPLVIDEFHLSLSQASAFQYATMGAIAVGAVIFGSLAEKLGRKATIVIGLSAYAAACLAFLGGNSFVIFTALLSLGGVGIAVFKVGALALLTIRCDRAPTAAPESEPVSLRVVCTPQEKALACEALKTVGTSGSNPTDSTSPEPLGSCCFQKLMRTPSWPLRGW